MSLITITTLLPVPVSATVATNLSAKVSAKPGTYYAYIDGLKTDEFVYPQHNIEIDTTFFAEPSGLGKDVVLEKECAVFEKTGDHHYFYILHPE